MTIKAKYSNKYGVIIISIIILLLLILSNMLCSYNKKYTNSTIYASEYCTAKGMCVLEKNTKKVLYSKNMDTHLANASTTKVLTAITVIQNCKDFDETITVSDLSVGVTGTSIYLKKGEQLKVIDLLYGLMLRSGNDSACALAYHIGGGDLNTFVEMMNNMAKSMGANNSHFANPHGLDEDNHYTTAYDLALITAHAMNNPLFEKIVCTKSYKIDATNKSDARLLLNKNKLLNSLEGCNGVKTGFTSNAGRCLVSSATRDNMTLISVVLNCGPMFEESTQLLNRGFNEYTNAMVVDKDKVIYNEYYTNNTKGQLNLKSNESYYLPIKKGDENDIVIKYNLYELKGNIDEDEEVGEISVFVNKHLQKTIKLYTINKIDVMNQNDALKSIQLQWEEKYEIK